MNHTAGEKLFCLSAVRRHVRGHRVSFQRVHAFPFFNHHKSVGSPGGLAGRRVDRINCSTIFNTALLGLDCRHIRPKVRQDGIAHTWLCCDDC